MWTSFKWPCGFYDEIRLSSSFELTCDWPIGNQWRCKESLHAGSATPFCLCRRTVTSHGDSLWHRISAPRSPPSSGLSRRWISPVWMSRTPHDGSAGRVVEVSEKYTRYLARLNGWVHLNGVVLSVLLRLNGWVHLNGVVLWVLLKDTQDRMRSWLCIDGFST